MQGVLEELVRELTLQHEIAIDTGEPQLSRILGRYANSEQNYANTAQQIVMHMPEILQGGRSILDVGPGALFFLVLARHLGNTVQGLEIEETLKLEKGSYPNPAGARNELLKYRNGYLYLAKYWNIPVIYEGLHNFLLRGGSPTGVKYDLIHCSRSLDAVLRMCTPQMGYAESARRFYNFCHEHLTDDGKVVIQYNMDDTREYLIRELEQDGRFLRERNDVSYSIFKIKEMNCEPSR